MARKLTDCHEVSAAAAVVLDLFEFGLTSGAGSARCSRANLRRAFVSASWLGRRSYGRSCTAWAMVCLGQLCRCQGLAISTYHDFGHSGNVDVGAFPVDASHVCRI